MRSESFKHEILIVDDEPANIRILCEILKQEYKVRVTTNGAEAVEISTSEKPPDLILLDIVMPEMDGREVCRRLKEDERCRNIPIIFITVMSSEDDETLGLKLGAVDYITKPFSPDIVSARVRTHLELKDHRDCLADLVEERTAELIKIKDEERQLLEMTTALSFELNLVRLLAKIMDTTQELLSADRCTLFLFDDKTSELWSQVAQGLESREIRIPCHAGIAGSVFTTGDTINIPDAYADERFNPEVDKKTGYQTQSILCMPVKNKKARIIGVTQVLNKKGGPFTRRDEDRLKAFSAQASIALENAKLFEDVLNMKNYNESVLESMSNGMISLDADKNVVKCNAAALKILRENPDEPLESSVANISIWLSKANPWILRRVEKVMRTRRPNLTMDTELRLSDESGVSVNLTIVPLMNVQHELIGSLLVLEDITSEKRLKGTIARYMTKEVAERLMDEDCEAVLGGKTQEATILFSDIRSFTSISEKITPQQTVALLNEYFTIMVDIVFDYKGTLDKYIGDAIMAVFGAPFSTGEDPDRAVKTSIDMLRALGAFNQERKAEAKDHIEIGIGINTKEVLSGNIGSMKRMDYTVIGDGVNLAARLESANKLYGTNILVSEFTYRELKDSYVCRETDLIQVKGKEEPVRIYQVLDYHDEVSFPYRDDVLDIFHKGLMAYRRREWERGANFFSQAIQLNDADSVSHLYLERCRAFEENPPGEDWRGVWVMQGK